MVSSGVGLDIKAGDNVAVTQILVHEQIAKIAPGPSHMRIVSDEALLVEAYDCGSSMVSNTVRAVRHIALAMATHSHTPLATHRAIEQIKEATSALEIDCRLTDPGYDAFGELVRVRDAMEHPSESSIYQGADSGWDQVPLAWLLSDRSLKTYVDYRHWFDLVARDWKARLAADAQPSKLTVERGMKSKYPAKKAK
jgi:hypothetical protein